MSCSKAKRKTPGPAIEVYDGPAFRSLRKALRRGIKPDVLVISAKYGLLRPESRIEPYDQKLTAAPDPAFAASLQAEFSHVQWHSYDTVFTFLGPHYERAVGDIASRLRPTSAFGRASGQIGLRLAALKIWFSSLESESIQ